MSGVAVIRQLLADAAPAWPAANVIPDARILGGGLPITTALPALGVSQVSGLERETVSMAEPSRLQTERVQVMVHATSYAQQKALVRLVATACRNRNGIVNGVALDSILPGGEGPDGFVADPVIYQQTVDFRVKWRT